MSAANSNGPNAKTTGSIRRDAGRGAAPGTPRAKPVGFDPLENLLGDFSEQTGAQFG